MSKKATPLTEEQIDALVDLYRGGETFAALAKKYGQTARTVRELLITRTALRGRGRPRKSK